MANEFEDYTDFDLNLMTAQYQMRGQPFIKYLPQQDLFGGEYDGTGIPDEDVHIHTESGRLQKIDLCRLSSRHSIGLMCEQKINVHWNEEGEGGYAFTDTSFFVDFKCSAQMNRAITIAFLISKGLLKEKNNDS